MRKEFHEEVIDGNGSRSAQTPTLWRNDAAGPLVGRAARGFCGAERLSRVRDLGGPAKRALRVRSVSLAVLFTAPLRRFAARVDPGRPSRMAARLHSVFTGPA